MNKYFIGIGVIVVAGILMGLPYFLRKVDKSEAPKEKVVETKFPDSQQDDFGDNESESEEVGVIGEEGANEENITGKKSEEVSVSSSDKTTSSKNEVTEKKDKVAQVAQEKPIEIDIRDIAFSPSKISVKKGTKVIWTNKESVPHTVTGDNGGPDSSTMHENQNYSFVFNKDGTFNYHCKIHPSMRGVVEVKE